MKEYGGFIPNYRAGRPTAEYLRYVINRITSAGALYLVIHCPPAVSGDHPAESCRARECLGTTLLIIIPALVCGR